MRTVYRMRDAVDWSGRKSILRDTYRGSGRNGRERERTAGKQSDISLKSSTSLYKVIGYAEVKCSVLSLNKITPPISNLAASADSFNLPLCFSLSLSHRSPPLVLVKIARNMTEIRVSFQRARELSCIETERKSFTGVNVLICSKTIITMWHGRGLSACAFGAYECVLSVFS